MPEIAVERVVLGGAASIGGGVEQLRLSLEQACARAPDVVVACEVTEMDLSGLQLLMAAALQARRNGGTLRLSRTPSGPLEDVLRRAGFEADAAGLYATEPLSWGTECHP